MCVCVCVYVCVCVTLFARIFLTPNHPCVPVSWGCRIH